MNRKIRLGIILAAVIAVLAGAAYLAMIYVFPASTLPMACGVQRPQREKVDQRADHPRHPAAARQPGCQRHADLQDRTTA